MNAAVITAVLAQHGPLLVSILSAPWDGISAVASIGCLSRIPEATETVQEEKRRVETERAAFKRFAAEIRDLNVVDDPRSGMNGLLLTEPGRMSGDTTETVRSLYRETIMSVDHYEEEYDEPLRTNITAELGPDFETAITTDDTLSQPLLDALAERSHSVAQDRREYTARVESELQSVTDAEERLQKITDLVERIQNWEIRSRPFQDLVDAEQELQAAEGRCKSIITLRQTEYVNAPKESEIHFREYLYQRYDWTHPVVSDVLDVVKNIQMAERSVLSAVVDRF